MNEPARSIPNFQRRLIRLALVLDAPSAPAILCSAHTLPTCSEPDPDGQTRRPPWKRGWLGGNEPKIRLAQVALVKAVSGNESSCDSKHAA